MSEKLCLQWNEFRDNIKNVFGILREGYDFADVTLACEDGQQVEAHKVILASSSPFFKKLLGRNKQPHPIIFMRRVKYDDLVALVEFLYSGEANICQDSLDSFFAIAEELQLKGLTSNKKEKCEANNKKPEMISPAIFTTIEKETSSKRPILEQTPMALPTEVSVDLLGLEDRVMSNMKNLNNLYFFVFHPKVKSLIEKSENKIDGRGFALRCKACGKEGRDIVIKGRKIKNRFNQNLLPKNQK